MGLSTVYGIVHAAGGYISVDNEKGIGTTFTIYLPRIEEGPKEKFENKSVRAAFSSMQTPKILLVDDEDGVRLGISRVLKSKGFKVIECACAEQSLKSLKNEPILIYC